MGGDIVTRLDRGLLLQDQSVLRFPCVDAFALFDRRFCLRAGFADSAQAGAVGFAYSMAFRGGRWCVGVLLGEADADPIPDLLWWDFADFLRCAEVDSHPVAIGSDPSVLDPLSLPGRRCRAVRHGLVGLDCGRVGYVYSVALTLLGEWQAVLGSGRFDGRWCSSYPDDLYQVLASVELLPQGFGS